MPTAYNVFLPHDAMHALDSKTLLAVSCAVTMLPGIGKILIIAACGTYIVACGG